MKQTTVGMHAVFARIEGGSEPPPRGHDAHDVRHTGCRRSKQAPVGMSVPCACVSCFEHTRPC